MSHLMPAISDLPAAQRLALSYAPVHARNRTAGLLMLDARMAGVLRAARQPIAVQLRLAWWRDILAKPAAEWPRGEPVLDMLRGWEEPAGLVLLADGWEALVLEQLDLEAIRCFAHGRAAAFRALARELALPAETTEVEDAARLWALADLATHVSDEGERTLIIDHARSIPVPGPLPGALRPLAVLAGLGARSLARGGAPLAEGPRSALAALRIGLFGR